MKLIDEELFPTKVTRNEHDSSLGAVRLGLSNLLGKDLFHAYDIATQEYKKKILVAALQNRLDNSITVAKIRRATVSDTLPAEISELVARDQGIPF
jgi:hypothetical protein